MNKKKNIFENRRIKKKVYFNGIPICIEFLKGDSKHGVDENNKFWIKTLYDEYGFIKGCKGFDKDNLDVYLGDSDESTSVYIIHQIKPDKEKFDEDKVFIGFDNQHEVLKCWCRYTPFPRKMFGGISKFDIDDFYNYALENNGYPLFSKENKYRFHFDRRFKNTIKK